MRTGDVVKHLPSGETWVVAWADEERLGACGWPETVASVADCELVESCSDEKHWKLVQEIARGPISMRQRRCFEIYDQRVAAECAAIMHL